MLAPVTQLARCVGILALLAGCGPLRLGSGAGPAAPTDNGRTFVYVGSAGGILVYELDRPTGSLVRRSSHGGLGEVSALGSTTDGRLLVAVSPGAGLVSLSIDPRSGALTQLDRAATGGGRPSGVVVDRSGKYALVANAGSANVAVLPIRPDGSFAPAHLFPAGLGARGVAVHPGNEAALVANQRAGSVSQFSFNTGTGVLTPKADGPVPLPPHAGPRSLAFHPSGRWVYVLDDTTDTIEVYGIDELSKTIAPLAMQTVSTLPRDFPAKKNHALDLRVAPSGRFVYGLNRGHDAIVTFAADPASGTLTPLNAEPCGGKDPSDFAMAPGGAYLLVAHEGSHTLTSFRLDATTGFPSAVHTVKLATAPLSVHAVAITPPK
jgi:6-phosphogluconolactonase